MANKEPLTAGARVGMGMVVIGIVVSVGLIMLVSKAWNDVRQLRASVEQLSKETKRIEELEQQEAVLGARMEEMKEFLALGEEGVAEVAESLEGLANSFGVELVMAFEDFPDQVDVGGVYQDGLGMTVVATGSYQGVLSWLKAVEKLPYLMSFSEIKVGLPRLGEGVRIEFEGVMYLR